MNSQATIPHAKLFSNQPDLQPAGKGLWRLNADWSIVLPISRRRLTLKAGFLTDGASIPRVLWTLFGQPFDPIRMAPALAHDALYAAELLPRAQCDREFLNLLQANDDTVMDAQACWLGVRVGGWWTWAVRNTQRTTAQARELVTLAAPLIPRNT